MPHTRALPHPQPKAKENSRGPSPRANAVAHPHADTNSNADTPANQAVNVLLIVSLLAAMWAEYHGNRAARALIASAGLVSALTLAGVRFDFGLWVSIDAAVICMIEALGNVGKRERAIIALFPLAWVLYQVQPPWWHDGVCLIVSAQFLLTVPWDRLEQRIWKARAA